MPQWIAYLAEGQPGYAVIAVLAGFGVIGAAAAVGYELRAGADSIRPSSAFLLSLNAIALAAAGWFALATGGHELLAKLWVVGLAAVHLAIGFSTTRLRCSSHDFGLLALVIGAVLADVAFASLVEGPARALGWVGAGVMFAALIRCAKLPVKDEALTALGLGAHVALALLQSITSDAPPNLLAGGSPLGLGAAISLAGVAAGCLVSARLAGTGQRELRACLDVVGLAVVAYLTALTLDGAPLTLAWAAEAVALVKLGSRTDDELSAWAGRGYLLLAFGHALGVMAPPAVLVDGLASPLGAGAALGAVAAAAAACAHLTGDGQAHVRGALEAASMTIAAYLAAAMLDGAALVVALAAGAVVLAELSRRLGSELIAAGALVSGLREPVAAAVALGAVVLAGIACAQRGCAAVPMREPLLGAAAVATLYLASALVVTPFQPGDPGSEASLLDLDVRQQGQVLLSALWSLAGFAALILGLRRDLGLVRMGALALLLVSVGKVFLFDLATLTSIYRVAATAAGHARGATRDPLTTAPATGSVDEEEGFGGAASCGDAARLLLETSAVDAPERLDGDLGLPSLRLDAPEARELPLVQHRPGTRHRTEQPFTQLRLRREKRPVGLLKIGVARRDQAHAYRPRRRAQTLEVVAPQPGRSSIQRDLGEVPLNALPEALRMGSRETGPVREVAHGGRSVEVKEALYGSGRRGIPPRLGEQVPTLGVEACSRLHRRVAPQHRRHVVTLAALAPEQEILANALAKLLV